MVPEADMAIDAIGLRRFLDIGPDRGAVGNRLGRAPRVEGEAQGVHVAVGSDTGIPKQVPRTPQRSPPFQDHIAAVRAAFLQVIRLPYPGNSRAHDDDVKMLGHRSLRIPVIRICGEATVGRVNSLANISGGRPIRPASPSPSAG